MILLLLLIQAVDATILEDSLKEGIKQTLKTYAVAMIVRLKLADSEDEITVANIHVSYNRPARPDRSSIQVHLLSCLHFHCYVVMTC